MTYLEAVNSVLTRLREPHVSTVKETQYSTLVGEFVNDAVHQVENAADWSALRATVRIDVSEGVFSYTLPDIKYNSEIARVLCEENNTFLRYQSEAWFTDRYMNRDVVETAPTHFTVNGTDTDGNAIIDIYPKPDQAYILYAEVVKRTHRITADDETLIVPWFPVIQLALAFAIRERGEVGSDTVTEQLAAAKNALSDAIAIDMQRNREELIWYTV
jgi:hypothetical protein